VDANARYLFSRVLTGSASSNVTSDYNAGSRSLIAAQQGNLTYTPDSIKLGKNSYNWKANGGAFNGFGSIGNGGLNNGIGSAIIPGDRGVTGGFNQNLQIPYTFNLLDKKLLMRSNIGQSVGARTSRINGPFMKLDNFGSVSLGAPLANSGIKEMGGGSGTRSGLMNTTASLTLNDSHIFGRNPSHARSAALSLNLNESGKTTYQRSGLILEGGVQSVQQTRTVSQNSGTQKPPTSQLALFGSATYAYSKVRVFNVRGLNYTGKVKVSTQSSFQSSYADANSAALAANAKSTKLPKVLEQELKYSIGQNELRLTESMSDNNGVKNASLWILFRTWRSIGR